MLVDYFLIRFSDTDSVVSTLYGYFYCISD